MALIRQSIPALNGGVSQQAGPLRGTNQLESAKNCSFTVAEGVSKRNPLEVLNLFSAPSPESAAGGFFAHIPWSSGDGFLLELPGDGTFNVYTLPGGDKLTAIEPKAGSTLYLTTPEGVDNATNWAVQVVGSKVYVLNKSVRPQMTAAVVAGTLGGTAQTLQDSALTSATEGSIWKILGDESNPTDTYYAKKVDGKWVEWALPQILEEFDPDSMPHVLTITEDEVDPLGFFTELDVTDWGKRLVGDEKSNKVPTFIGKPITGLFFDSDRLGLLADNSVIMSETGEHTNFWRTTVTDILDTDRIDITVASDGSSTLYWARNLGQQTILGAPDKQFALVGRPIMSPRTISVTEATSFPSSRVCQPVAIGPNLYFASNTSTGTTVWEMFVQEDAVTNDAANVSAHVPSYIDQQIVQMAANPNYEWLGLRPRTGNKLWVYQSFWAGDQKVQSSWNQWELTGVKDILSIFCVGDYLYLVYTDTRTGVANNANVYMGRIHLQSRGRNAVTSGPYGHGVMLDQLVRVSGTYNAGEDRTYWVSKFPVFHSTYRPNAVMVKAEGTNAGSVVELSDSAFNSVSGDPFQFYVVGDASADDVWIGMRYEMRFRFSEQFWKDGERSALAARVQIRNFIVAFKDTPYFRTEVTGEGTPIQAHDVIPSLDSAYTSRTLGTATFLLGSPVSKSGIYRFPVYGKSNEVKVEIINEEYTPCHFISAEWEGLVTTRTR